jgi:hypothetical protein
MLSSNPLKKKPNSSTKRIYHFFADNFFRMSFLTISTFANFEVEHGRNGSKKRKKCFCKCVLEFNFATINGLVEPSC